MPYEAWILQSGDGYDGIYEATFNIYQHSAQGHWRADFIHLSDEAPPAGADHHPAGLDGHVHGPHHRRPRRVGHDPRRPLRQRPLRHGPVRQGLLRLLRLGAVHRALLNPATGVRRELHPFGDGAMVARLQGWRFNQLERVLFRALDELGVNGCCGEPSHGGSAAALGMDIDGYEVSVLAVPLEIDLPESEGPGVEFTCGRARYRLGDGSYDRHPDQETIERAADLLSTRLYCQPSRGPRPVTARSVRLAGEPVRGSEVTLVATGLDPRGQSASVWFNQMVVANALIEPDGSYRARFILPDTRSGSFRLLLDEDGHELGRARFTATSSPAGTALRTVMIVRDTEPFGQKPAMSCPYAARSEGLEPPTF